MTNKITHYDDTNFQDKDLEQVKSSKKFEITNKKINIKSHIKADKKKKLPNTSHC